MLLERVSEQLLTAERDMQPEASLTINDLKDRIVELQQELENQKAESRRNLVELDKKNSVLVDNQLQTLQKTEAERLLLSKQLEVFKRLDNSQTEGEVKSLKDTMEKLQCDNSTLMERIQVYENQITSIQTEKTKEGQELKRRLEELRNRTLAENTNLKEQVASLELALQGKSTIALNMQRENSLLKEESRKLRVELDHLKEQNRVWDQENGEDWGGEEIEGELQGLDTQTEPISSDNPSENLDGPLGQRAASPLLTTIPEEEQVSSHPDRHLFSSAKGSGASDAPRYATMEEVNQAIQRATSPTQSSLLSNQPTNIIQLMAETNARTMEKVIPSVMENCKKVFKDQKEGATNEEFKFDPFVLYTADQQGKGLEKWLKDLEQRFREHWSNENKTHYAQKHLDKIKDSLKT